MRTQNISSLEALNENALIGAEPVENFCVTTNQVKPNNLNYKSRTVKNSQRIVFVTGTRADFGKLEPLIIKARDCGFDVSIFITGMHLLEQYGLTKIEVRRLKGVSFFEFHNDAESENQELVLSRTVCGFSDYIDKVKPELVIIHGDRIEAMSCAIVCATNYVLCGHIEGGEVSGTIDEALRHCNTKLAHHHFVSSITAGKRVRRLGESAGSVHVIGSPELDYHKNPLGVSLSEVKKKYEINFDEYGICIFHPVTSEKELAHFQAETLFTALENSQREFVVLLPNNDPGCSAIIKRIDRLPKNNFRVIPSMRFAYFSELLRNCSCILGNSSTGVREAPFLGIPSLNFGTRQYGRSKSPSITDVENLDSKKIIDFLRTQWTKKYLPDDSFGCGDAAQKFASVITDPNFGAPVCKSISMTTKKSRNADTVAIVPARVGSRGLARKNFLDFGGKSLCEHAVDQGLRVADKCILSTDDCESIKRFSSHPKVLINHRLPELADDKATMFDVLQDVITSYALTKEIIILLQPTAPLRTDEIINDLLQLFNSESYDLVMSISETDNSLLKSGFFEEQKFKPVNEADYCFSNRQDLPKMYKPNGAAFIFRANWLLKTKVSAPKKLVQS